MNQNRIALLLLFTLGVFFNVEQVFAQGTMAANYCNNLYPLQRKPYIELPIGSIKPTGWLKEMLLRQSAGMSSSLDLLYPEVMGERNGWLGGDGDQWERGPYWIDGLLPLAYILDDDLLKQKIQPWIEWTLASQREDGFFGPSRNFEPEIGLQRNNSEDWWPRMVVLKVLKQYYSATGDKRVITFLTNYFHYQLRTLPYTPLGTQRRTAMIRRKYERHTSSKSELTAEEKLRIAYACKELHLTQSELVRRVLYGVNVKHTVVVAQGGEDALAALAALSAQCSKVGSNLNQLARHFNSGGKDTEQLRAQILEELSALTNFRLKAEETVGETVWATIKHLTSKNSNYAAAESLFSPFQHNEYTGLPILDEKGRPKLRDSYLLDTLECGESSFAMACLIANRKYGKNGGREDVKTHHYIVSFDPKDAVENGLTMEWAQAQVCN